MTLLYFFLVLLLAAVLFLTGKVFQLKKGKRHCRHPAGLPPHGGHCLLTTPLTGPLTGSGRHSAPRMWMSRWDSGW